jgi:hypothetical protein
MPVVIEPAVLNTRLTPDSAGFQASQRKNYVRADNPLAEILGCSGASAYQFEDEDDDEDEYDCSTPPPSS